MTRVRFHTNREMEECWVHKRSTERGDHIEIEMRFKGAEVIELSIPFPSFEELMKEWARWEERWLRE